jgi:hypothetical protein
VTGLIAGSIAFIALSGVALAFGWLGESSPLIWTSIVASVASGVCLALAYQRSRAAAAKVPPPPPAVEPVRVRPAARPAGDDTSPSLFGPDSGLDPD